MVDADTFGRLLQRVRDKDEAAVAELMDAYGPAIRRTIRFRLRSRMRRTLDTVDVAQSVFARFFVRAALGDFDIEKPEQLLGLLLKMANDKVIDQQRKADADRRDQRRLEAAGDEQIALAADAAPSPSRVIAGRELLDEVRRRLSDDERQLADWRAEGRAWPEIAADVGDSAKALRKRLSRALDRVMCELNLEDDHE